jgi:hypothetical protein
LTRVVETLLELIATSTQRLRSALGILAPPVAV